MSKNKKNKGRFNEKFAGKDVESNTSREQEKLLPDNEVSLKQKRNEVGTEASVKLEDGPTRTDSALKLDEVGLATKEDLAKQDSLGESLSKDSEVVDKDETTSSMTTFKEVVNEEVRNEDEEIQANTKEEVPTTVNEPNVDLKFTGVDITRVSKPSLNDILEKNGVDISQMRESKAVHTRRASSVSGPMSLINSANSGKRASIQDTVIEKIGDPERVKVILLPKLLILTEALGDEEGFVLKKSGRKRVIYSTSLVLELTEAFELDYSNRVSITFTKVEYSDYEGRPVAVISR
jgi:hypothetical protein